MTKEEMIKMIESDGFTPDRVKKLLDGENPYLTEKEMAEFLTPHSTDSNFDKIYDTAIDHCIRTVERIGLETNPINPPNVVAGLIIQELKKLKG